MQVHLGKKITTISAIIQKIIDKLLGHELWNALFQFPTNFISHLTAMRESFNDRLKIYFTGHVNPHSTTVVFIIESDNHLSPCLQKLICFQRKMHVHFASACIWSYITDYIESYVFYKVRQGKFKLQELHNSLKCLRDCALYYNIISKISII